MGGMIYWSGREVAFRAGETVASALLRAGIAQFGQSGTGLERGIFCGIGQCQCCVVMLAGRPVEACLLRCVDGMNVEPQQWAIQ